MGKPRKGAPQVMRGERDTEPLCVRPDDLEDRLGLEPPGSDLTVAINAPEHRPTRNSGGAFPADNCIVGPQRNRHAAHAAVFADQVHDEPASLAMLDVVDVERCYLGTAQPGAEQKAEHCAVADTFDRAQVGNSQ